MKHTPAPWKVEHNARIEIFQDTEPGQVRPVAHVYVSGKAYGVRYAIPEAEANARLIAAAPELLTSLQILLDALSRNGGSDSVAVMTAKVQARAALSKAQG